MWFTSNSYVTVTVGTGSASCTCPRCGYSSMNCDGHPSVFTVVDDRRNYFDDLEPAPPEPIDGLIIGLNWWRESPDRPPPRLPVIRWWPQARAPPIDL